MNLFDDILEDIAWRKEQLLMAKTIPFLHSFSDSHKEFLIKHSIPTIYAIWEGFVQNSFQIYVRELNKLGLRRNDYCINIFTHSLEASFPQFKEFPKEFPKKMTFMEKMNNYLEEDFRVSAKINTESNVELEVINKLCTRFNLELLPNHPYKQKLKDLLMFRNRIAHGDNSLVVDIENFKDNIESYILLIEDLMEEVYNRMITAFNNDKSYLKN
jgi:hypothetical protein